MLWQSITQLLEAGRPCLRVSNPFTTPGAELDATSLPRKLITGNLSFSTGSISMKHHYPCFTPGKLIHMLVMRKAKGISLRSVRKVTDSQRFKSWFVKCQIRTVTISLSLPMVTSLNSSTGGSQVYQSCIGIFKG